TEDCPHCCVVHQWPGLPKGVKFDPPDQELLGHLLAKHAAAGSQPDPFIEEFIPTVEEADGICYTHPQKLPGVKQDGSVSHFFHRTFKAYNTRTRKRRKINTGDLADVCWHKIGKTKPVIVDGQYLGCKKIMVLYMSTVKGGKPKKTNWVMHQYHLGTGEDEQNGEYVVSKLFFQQQSKVSGNCLSSNTGSPFGGGGSPSSSTDRLFLRIGYCSKTTLSISSLSSICISFSCSSKYCSKGSVGGTTIEAKAIVSSLLVCNQDNYNMDNKRLS
ncbi:hypothetical protein ZWY2020_055709, partial [Hordeum vulgare]